MGIEYIARQKVTAIAMAASCGRQAFAQFHDDSAHSAADAVRDMHMHMPIYQPPNFLVKLIHDCTEARTGVSEPQVAMHTSDDSGCA